LQFFARASTHGDSSVTIDNTVISNSDFFSQQLDAWLHLLQDEFSAQYMSAAAATVEYQPSLKWTQRDIEKRLSSIQKE
jgi:hypothetical protein